MDASILPLTSIVIAFFVGAALWAIFIRLRLRFQVEKAVEADKLIAEQPLHAALAQYRERAALLDEQRLALEQRLTNSENRADALRCDLDRSHDETAKLTERAQRVVKLEEELALAREELLNVVTERQQLTADLATSAERASALDRQLFALRAESKATAEQLAESRLMLTETGERKAALETTASRVPALEQKLDDTQQRLEGVSDELARLRETTTGDAHRLTALLSNATETVSQLRAELELERDGRVAAQRSLGEAREVNSVLRTELGNEKSSAAEKLEVLTGAKDEFKSQLLVLANELFEDKSKRLADQNNMQLGQLLDPLKTQINEFKVKVDDVYVKEGQERASLKTELQNLLQLNQTLSKEAHDLTRALKGEAKTRGSWGEMVLEKILEACGLRDGSEYSRQETAHREDGSRAQPDVIINLPEGRRLVIDSKVSLIAYNEYVSATNPREREVAARKHVDSIRAHLKELSNKQYQTLYGLRSVDFVLMFVSIEPAYTVSIEHDCELWLDAWRKNVMLVSPSTLLCVLRMVAFLWRQESQNRNAQEIAKRGAELYDKLALFVQDLQDVGKRLDAARESYDAASKRLASGKGNVLRQAQMLKELGVKPTKALDGPLVDRAMSSETLLVEVFDDGRVDTGEPVNAIAREFASAGRGATAAESQSRTAILELTRTEDTVPL